MASVGSDDREWLWAIGEMTEAIEDLHDCEVMIWVKPQRGERKGYVNVFAGARRVYRRTPAPPTGAASVCVMATFPTQRTKTLLALQYQLLHELDYLASQSLWVQAPLPGCGPGQIE